MKIENKERARQWAVNNPERYKNNLMRANLMRVHKMTVEEYNTIVQKQNGLCDCCGNPNYAKRLAVDHDHATGKIRGLLCHTRNNHLGIFERKMDMFNKYLEKHR